MSLKPFGKMLSWLALAANAAVTAALLAVAYSPWIPPTTHPVLSCLGLAFPIFAALNGICLLGWCLLRRWRQALLPLAGFALCLPQLQAYLPLNLLRTDPPKKSIKLLSYNVMGFDGCTWQDGHNPILDYLAQSDADILCLQEYATREAKGHLRQRHVEQALSAYPYHCIRTVGRGPGQGSRLACYSKYPILSARVARCTSDYNGAMVCEVVVKGDTLTLINNHLESNKLTKADKVVYEDMLRNPDQDKVKDGLRLLVSKLAEASAIRAPQADTIATEVARARHPYVVVCGDFNDTPISYTHHTIGRQLDDAFTQSGLGLGISYNQNRFYFRIDHILVSKNLQTYRCTVDRSIRHSDHYPIWCHIGPRT